MASRAYRPEGDASTLRWRYGRGQACRGAASSGCGTCWLADRCCRAFPVANGTGVQRRRGSGVRLHVVPQFLIVLMKTPPEDGELGELQRGAVLHGAETAARTAETRASQLAPGGNSPSTVATVALEKRISATRRMRSSVSVREASWPKYRQRVSAAVISFQIRRRSALSTIHSSGFSRIRSRESLRVPLGYYRPLVSQVGRLRATGRRG